MYKDDKRLKIEKELKEKYWSDIEKEEVDKRFDHEMANHKMSVIINGFEVSYAEHAEKLRESEVEVSMLLKFDKLGFVPVAMTEHNEAGHFTAGSNLYDFIDAIKYEKLERYVYIHSHPANYAASPSPNDIYLSLSKYDIAGILGNRLLDDCIITNYDYFSFVQSNPEHFKRLGNLMAHRDDPFIEKRLKNLHLL